MEEHTNELGMERPALPRFDDVDILRGLSIISVVLLHSFIRLFGAGFRLQDTMPKWAFHLFFLQGGNGVTVFFVISGFLITLTSLRRFGSLAKMRPKVFYRIRFARIAPLLLLVLAILSVLHLVHAPGFRIPAAKATLPRALLAAVTFHLNWLEAKRGYLPANWDVMWSLSIEEMFYVFFPLACVAMLRWRRGMWLFGIALMVFIVLGPFGRTILNATDIEKEKSYLGGMDGLAIGVLTALLTDWLLRRGGLKTVWIWVLRIGGGGLMLLLAWWPTWHHFLRPLGRSGLDSTVLAIAAAMVMVAGVVRGRRGRSWTAPIRWFGRHSYEVYLTHEFVIVWMTMLYVRWHRGPLLAWSLTMLALSAPLGWAVAHWFSEPMNRRLRGARAAR